MYLTYDEYKRYGGTWEEPTSEAFTAFEFRARKRIDYLTDSRVSRMKVVPESVKLCMVSLIDTDRKYGVTAQLESPVLTSFNNDGYSESYGGVADQMSVIRKSANTQIQEMLYGEVDDFGVPLLYRGVTPYAHD